MSVELGRLFEGHPHGTGEALFNRRAPEHQDVDAGIGLPVVAQGANDPSRRVFGVPGFDPGANALFEGLNYPPGDAGINVLPFGALHVCSPVSAPRFLVTRTWRGRTTERGPSPEGNAQHGTPAKAGGMERAAALTGPAGRPMIASGYEKAGRGWTNSLLPNGMKNVSAHLAIGSVPDVRLRATDTPAMGI